MGHKQSKDELLYEEVCFGNIDAIKSLCADGASLEWIDDEGKTPLIVACMSSALYDAAKTLIDLGADINAYCPGRLAGTPLHHAAKLGLDLTVQLLLSHRANALVMNDSFQIPLDMARSRGHINVVRTIEAHICLFSGWLRELHGLSFVEVLAPKFLSRKVWVVVLPRLSSRFMKTITLELAIYTNMQDAEPRTIVELCQANIEEPDFNQNLPVVIISKTSTGTRLKLGVLKENDKQQLHSLCNACKGIPQVTHASFPLLAEVPVHASAPVHSEEAELAMAIEASLQSLTLQIPEPICGADTFSSTISPADVFTEEPIPSAPTTDVGPIHYPTIDATPVDLSVDGYTQPPVESSNTKPDEVKDAGTSSCCAICLDAPLEGACVPCGHMAGCMSCLNEIKEKKWGCPVCRGNINQVLRIFSV